MQVELCGIAASVQAGSQSRLRHPSVRPRTETRDPLKKVHEDAKVEERWVPAYSKFKGETTAWKVHGKTQHRFYRNARALGRDTTVQGPWARAFRWFLGLSG